MKIKGSADLSTQDAVKVLTGGNKTPQGAKANARATDKSDETRVNVGLGSVINSEFDTTKLGAERRKKVEDLKELVRQGKYNPDSHAVAQSISDEISFTILTEGGANSGE